MKHFVILLLALSIVSCDRGNKQNLTVKGHVKDLKKGTVYLQKLADSSLVNLDSLTILGDDNFELHTNIEEPEILFLTLDKNAAEDNTIAFFADKGTTEIYTSLKNFNFDAKINGSEQQKILDEYILMMSKFNNRNLELIKESFESKKEKDSSKIIDYETEYNNLLKRKYLYTINFAINKNNSEVAPYLALTEIPNTSLSYLEKIYDTLTDNIKQSKYGKELKSLILERKKEEKNQE